MSAAVTGEADPPQTPDSPKSSQEIEAKTNQDLPARTMIEDRQQPTAVQSEDPATVAASEELKHTSISDKDPAEAKRYTNTTELEAESAVEDRVMLEAEKARHTPEPFLSDDHDEEMRERISSPKKKRGRDQDDDGGEPRDDDLDERGSSAESSVVNGSRSKRLEPEKKRVRDGPEDRSSEVAEAEATEIKESKPAAETTTTKDAEKKETESSDKPSAESAPKETLQTSSSAFASSGFASLAVSSTSPFGAVGASKPSVFGALAGPKSPTLGSTVSTSGFGALGGNATASGFGFGSGSTSGFGGLGSGSTFGSALGNGFAGGSGPKLSSFAAPGAPSAVGTSKPAKAFGAPESDEEEGSDTADTTEGGHGTDDEEAARGNVSPEEKKKGKLQKVYVDDGEAGEATLLQIRAKLFAISSTENGWKERGVGTLKINVPQPCVSWDDSGHPLPGSFDISGLDDEDATAPKIPRLILRQENTHRVILNTALLKTMRFQDKPATSTAQIFFTAIEGDKEPKPVNMLLKMSEANAVLFRSEVASIQREL